MKSILLFSSNLKMNNKRLDIITKYLYYLGTSFCDVYRHLKCSTLFFFKFIHDKNLVG